MYLFCNANDVHATQVNNGIEFYLKLHCYGNDKVGYRRVYYEPIITSVVLYSKCNFQVEIVLCAPRYDGAWAEHTSSFNGNNWLSFNETGMT